LDRMKHYEVPLSKLGNMKFGNWARNLREEFNKTVILFILCIVN
jgi:hypothetical protein